MGIHPVNLGIISGQKNSGEIAVATSTLLSQDWQSITPICIEKSVRKDLLAALDNYLLLDNIYPSKSSEYYVQKLVEASQELSINHHFWLALDLEGYRIAKDIFLTNGHNPDEKVHGFVNKLNLLDRRVKSPPLLQISSDYLSKIKNNLFYLSEDYKKMQPEESFASFVNKRISFTTMEQEYYSWFKTLHEYIAPWKNIIDKIQASWS
jgi:hypothetical protein